MCARGNFPQRHRRRSYIRNGQAGAARASAWVSAPARNCSSVVRNRSGSRRATCKDRLLHSCRFDSTFLHSFSPRGRWASSGVFLHFAPPTRTRGKQSRSLFDFAAFALLRGRENGYYELTSGTMRYARPTNASGNNARSRAISTAAAANMNNLIRSDAFVALYSRAWSLARTTIGYSTYKCRESSRDAQRKSCPFFTSIHNTYGIDHLYRSHKREPESWAYESKFFSIFFFFLNLAATSQVSGEDIGIQLSKIYCV